MEGHARGPVLPLRVVFAAVAASLVSLAAQAPAPPAAWEQWRTLPGVVDVVGPRPDGSLVAAAAGGLHLVGRDGNISPFGDYRTDPGPESYVAMVPGEPRPGPGCRFQPGEVFALELATPPLGVVRVTAEGRASRLADLADMEFLGGIAFDGTGRFGNRLLVVARRQGKTLVVALDCRGGSTVVADDVPLMEGGVAVAPDGFGDHGGDLVGADELSGDVVFVRPDGRSGVLVKSGLPAGADVGVESVGFVPPEFEERRGAALVADRRGSTDALWRLDDATIRRAGVGAGDLLVATEQGGRTIAVRCRATCRVLPVAQMDEGAHVEGHVTVLLDPPVRPGYNRTGTIAFLSVVAFVIVAGTIVVLAYRRKSANVGNQTPT